MKFCKNMKTLKIKHLWDKWDNLPNLLWSSMFFPTLSKLHIACLAFSKSYSALISLLPLFRPRFTPLDSRSAFGRRRNKNILIGATWQDVLMKDATQKTPHESVAFLHLYRLFSGGKVRKNAFFGKSVFPRERRHFRDAAERSYGLVWLEHRG